MPDCVAETLHKRAARAEKRVAYELARKSGHSRAESVRIAGLHRSTGKRLDEALAKGSLVPRDARSLLDREELAALLARVLRKAEQESLQYVAPLAAQYSALQGLNQPVKAQLDVRHLFPGVKNWLESLPAGSNDDDAIDVTPTPTAELPSAATVCSDTSDKKDYVNEADAPPEPPK